MKIINKIKCHFGKHKTKPMWPRARDQYRECIHCGQVQKMIGICGKIDHVGLLGTEVRIKWQDVASESRNKGGDDGR